MMDVISFGGYLISFLFVLSIIVIVHEWGHFFIARRCGVQIVVFSIGFGKKLWSRIDKKGTKWQVCAIPLGGYVQMLGDEDAASMKKSDAGLTKEEQKHTFMAQPLWKKVGIIFAGPFMNYFFAIVTLVVILTTVGYIRIPPVVGEVLPQSAAQKAGLQKGDVILSVNEKKVEEFSDLKRAIVFTDNGEEVILTVLRGTDTFDVTIYPQSEKKGKMPQIGVVAPLEAEPTFKKYSIPDAMIEATKMAYDITFDTLVYLGQILTGKRTADDLRGPIGIAEASGDAAKAGFWEFIMFIVQVSIAIGFINLLPIPMLDGGHLAMYAVEAVTRQPISEKMQMVLFRAGVMLIFAVFIFTLFKDIPRVFGRIFHL